MGILFVIVPIFIAVVWAIVIGKIVKSTSDSVKENRNNDRSPIETKRATVVTKRTKIVGDHARTYYYATFEDDYGSRMEFKVSGEQSGLLVEGDEGTLTHQGTRFLSFER